MRKFIKLYIDVHPGLLQKICNSGINRHLFADIIRGRCQPKPEKLWHICFVIAAETNQSMHDILLAAVHLIEKES